MNEHQEIELANLRGEVEMLRFALVELLKGKPGGTATLATAMDRARKSTEEGPGRIALEFAHNRMQELFRQ